MKVTARSLGYIFLKRMARRRESSPDRRNIAPDIPRMAFAGPSSHSTGGSSRHSALSTGLLQQHDSGIAVKDDTGDKIKSWMAQVPAVKLDNPPMSSAKPQAAVPEAGEDDLGKKTEGTNVKPTNVLPTWTVTSEAATGNKSNFLLGASPSKLASPSIARCASKVHSLDRRDSRGNLGSVQMNQGDRYQPHKGENNAFVRIAIHDMLQVIQRGDVPVPNDNADLNLKQLGHPEADKQLSDVASKLRRASMISRHASTLAETESSSAPPPPTIRSRFLTLESNVPASASGVSAAPSNVTALADDKPEVVAAESTSPEAKPALKMPFTQATKMMKGIKRWQKKGKSEEVKKFVKGEEHRKLLRRNTQTLATDLPLPMKISMIEEVFPIAVSTVKAYERDLGKNHPMTVEARDRLDELSPTHTILTNM